jgi:alkylation response protein AidB-like acyl-CoA dehydrogenase
MAPTDTLARLDRLAAALTDEQRAVAASVHDFARRRVAPGAAERDRTARFPADVLRDAAELGLHAMKVPAADGGAGADDVTYALVMEAVAEACASVAVVLASSNLTAKVLSSHATDAQRARWLRPYAEGRLGPAAFALTEPGSGTDASALRTTARADGDGFVLDGEKMWITSATAAGLFLVFARTDGPGPDGISAFVIEAGTPGLVVGREEDKMGQRASGTAPVHLEACRVRADALVGPRGGGYRAALAALGAGRVGIAALSIGLAEAALAEGVTYAATRHAFGRPLAAFQNTEFVLADSRTELDAAWLLTLRAARLLAAGERASAETSMAKLFASEASGRIVDRMVQIHGGYGYSRESAVERIYRDARVTRIYEGTSEAQRIVISREVLRAAR